MKIKIYGAGTWGTALAELLVQNGHDVTLWHYNIEFIKYIKKSLIHPNLDSHRLSKKIDFTSQIDLSHEIDFVVIAIPSQAIRDLLAKINFDEVSPIVVSVSKGLENHTGKTISQVISENPNIKYNKICVLYGPSHAEEVLKKIPTTIVASSPNNQVAVKIQEAFSNQYFRVYRNPDTIGVELGGSIKNVISLAAGICKGVGFGDNTIAALLVRGSMELASFGVKLGAKNKTFFGLSGMGDLIVTATSNYSRNRQVGEWIGEGVKLEQISNKMNMVVEGLETTKAIMVLAKKNNIEMPICSEVYKVIFEGKNALVAMNNLMTRELTLEYENN
ncbi:MAG: glycerol-3-phosphate dehydrogenase [Candidatus Marinimicrobia bacterium]|nr:glycerol-3-phosphate dehydrogenase [Candidatus Neomarinimicrobiota bacterium]